MEGSRAGRVLVIGAGIGGLTAAIALERAGFEVIVFEKNDPLRALGSGYVLQPNAIKALGTIGMREPVEAIGGKLEFYDHKLKNGKLLKRMTTGQNAAEIGSAMMGVSRPGLQQVLLEGLGSAEVRLGARFTALSQDADGVTATFEDGSEERGSALIGCDGAHSAVRPHFDKTPLRYVGYRSFLAVTSYGGIEPGVHVQTYGTHSLFGMVPMGGGKAYWYGSETGPAGQYAAPEANKARALELFGDWHEPIRAVIENTDAEAIMPFDIHDLPNREGWATGRVTLAGDAAHAMAPALGQGACQSIEDGVVLGRHLRGAEDVPAALRAYEAERVARTAPIVKFSKFQGKLIQGDTPLTRAARMAMLRGAPPPAVKKQSQKLWSGFKA
jgi:2-polyprenyl-6-methoxyphenol hydroxylase-like FAD-dependent oxidoreductase